MLNVKLIIAYDGTDFLGWQKTAMGPSIEGTLQDVLERILQQPIVLQAASRTDAGVHANGQVVNFLASKKHLDLKKLCSSLNSLLPKAIVVLDAALMDPSFHPTLECTSKEYHYYLCCGPTQMPQQRFYSWHCPYKLDRKAMQEAKEHLIGQHNFEAFCNMKNEKHYQSYVREVQRLEIVEFPGNRLRFEVAGSNFLYKMVRNIVGTLVYVGRGRLRAEEIPQIIADADRAEAGVTAPSHGLTLHRVNYH